MDTIENVEEQVVFFKSVYNKFLEARRTSQQIDFYYGLCGSKIRLSFAGEELVSHITPALSHLQISKVETPDLTVCLWDSKSTGTRMVPPPWKRNQYTNRGDIWGYNSNRIKTAFHWIEFSLNLFDSETNTGLFWVENAANLPFWVHASPLRSLFHWWLEKNGSQLIHAAAVGSEQGAVLLTGKGGIGKSTTALSCLKSGLLYLGDDYVAIRLKDKPFVFSIYNTAKLNADHTVNFSEFVPLISNVEKLDDEKAVMFLNNAYSHQITVSLPLKAILVPSVTHSKESQITEAAPENILRAASFITMTQLPGADVRTFEFLNQLSFSLPCFNLEVGQDLSSIPTLISALLEDVSLKAPLNVSQTKDDPGGSSSAKTLPLVSVIVPVFNGEKFIPDAIDNIMSQNYPSIEIIIVNDGSTDDTEKVINRLSTDIRYFKQENGGPASARNKGIKEASGEYIAFLDVDDLWPKDNLKKLVKELSQEHSLDVVHGYAQLAMHNPVTDVYDYQGNPVEAFPFYIGAALYRKTVFNKAGLFDTALLFDEDTDWFQRAKGLNMNIKRFEDITLIVRRHGRNMTRNKDMIALNTLRVFKKTLDRTRAEK
jgi:hypothetical protein